MIFITCFCLLRIALVGKVRCLKPGRAGDATTEGIGIYFFVFFNKKINLICIFPKSAYLCVAMGIF